jgi:hypothetical protein
MSTLMRGSVAAEAACRLAGEEEGSDSEFHDREHICTLFLSTAEDVAQAVHAADTLFLGVRVHNRLVAEDEPGAHYGEWVLDLFAEALYVDE